MAGPQVVVEMSAADANLVAKWQELREKGPDAYEKSLRKVTDNSRSMKAEAEAFLGGMILKWTSVEFAVQKVSEAIRKVIELELEHRRIRNTAATSHEEATAKFLNQTRGNGISENERRGIAQQAATMSSRYGVGGVQGIGFATELATRGVSERNISGFLGEALKFSTAQGEPLSMDLLQALIEQTRANDDKLSPGTLRQVTQSMIGLKDTQLTPQQLLPFSKTNLGLQQAGLSVQEQLAFNATTLDLYGGDAAQAATFNRAFATHLRAPSPKGATALAGMGLKNTDVDFIGENMGDVLQRLSQGLGRIDATLRVPALKHLFGEEYGATAAALIDRQSQYNTNVVRAMGGGAAMSEMADRNLGTGASIGRRAVATKELADALRGSSASEAGGQVLAAILSEQGAGGAVQSFAQAQYKFAEFFDQSQSPDQATARVKSILSADADIRRGLKGVAPDASMPGRVEELMLLREISAKLDNKEVVIVGNEAAREDARTTPARPPLQTVGGR